jgi:hypothetical protein
MSTEFLKIPLSLLLHLGYTETLDSSQILRNSILTDFHQKTASKDIPIPMSHSLLVLGTALVGLERYKKLNATGVGAVPNRENIFNYN